MKLDFNISDDDFKKIFKAVIKKAKEGDEAAISFLLSLDEKKDN